MQSVGSSDLEEVRPSLRDLTNEKSNQRSRGRLEGAPGGDGGEKVGDGMSHLRRDELRKISGGGAG